MVNIEQIRERLQTAIKECGLTQTEIARRLNIYQSAVGQYMSGRALPSLETFANLCKIIGVSPNEILCYED